jgi:hypothetical protein
MVIEVVSRHLHRRGVVADVGRESALGALRPAVRWEGAKAPRAVMPELGNTQGVEAVGREMSRLQA